MNINNLIQNFEQEKNCQVVYITMYGSKLMDYIDEKLNVVQKKLEESELPERSDEVFIDGLILGLVEENMTI